MDIDEKVKDAIENYRMADYLRGKEKYYLRCADDINDFESAVYGVFDYYNETKDENVKKQYENAYNELLTGDLADIYVAFECARIQVKSEIKNIAPFSLDKQVYVNLRNSISKNANELEEYNYMIAMNDYMGNEYGRKIM